MYIIGTVDISDIIPAIIDSIKLFGAIKIIRFRIVGVISGKKLDLVGTIKVNFI